MRPRLLIAVTGLMAALLAPMAALASEAAPFDVPAITAKAGAGDTAAMITLGALYATQPAGAGTSHTELPLVPDDRTAVHWYRRAADRGDPVAMYLLAELYERGAGVRASMAEAARWHARAERAATPKTWLRLGEIHRSGFGAPQDHVQARALFGRAAATGDAEAMYAIAQLLNPLGFAAPPQDAEAVDWLQRAAAAGHRRALLDLAGRREFGRGTPKDLAIAEAEFRRAAASADPQASFELAEFLSRRGRHQEATALYEQAAGAGHYEARNSIALAYALGRGVPQDEEQAIAWLRAAGRSRGEATADIGFLLKDQPEGEGWLRRAAAQGRPEAFFWLAGRYWFGNGGAKDRAEAVRLYEAAAAMGNEEAMEFLVLVYDSKNDGFYDPAQAESWRRQRAARKR